MVFLWGVQACIHAVSLLQVLFACYKHVYILLACCRLVLSFSHTSSKVMDLSQDPMSLGLIELYIF